ncbi:ankyrin repeat domain-containing protein [Streptomyces aurantiogriseus]|uniref:ankyrin repeat domain-containing protein n=1 Tax=Streptomyces aurantiogriseus TaxID=66870 RepID=UPI00167BB35F|nr:ankyrin repeat domain-containing protein [Streptomyces aurantiogriseus]
MSDEPIEAWRARRPTAEALYAAVRQGDVDGTRALIEAGADPDQIIGEYDEYTPLTLAADMGHLAVVELLLDAGVHPDSQNRFGYLPVVMAAKSAAPHSEIVDLLVRRGADLDAEMKGRSARAWLALPPGTEHDSAGAVDTSHD